MLLSVSRGRGRWPVFVSHGFSPLAVALSAGCDPPGREICLGIFGGFLTSREANMVLLFSRSRLLGMACPGRVSGAPSCARTRPVFLVATRDQGVVPPTSPLLPTTPAGCSVDSHPNLFPVVTLVGKQSHPELLALRPASSTTVPRLVHRPPGMAWPSRQCCVVRLVARQLSSPATRN